MPVPRPHRRALTVATAAALALGSAPFVGFARAAAPSIVAYAIPVDPATNKRVIGPNAGFPYSSKLPGSIDRGVRGHTPLAVISLDADVQITSAKLRISSASSPVSDFAASDGFALYRDVDPDGAGGPDGKFREVDYQAGRVSTGFQFDSVPGFVEATITAGPDAVGATTYFLTAHPSGTQVADRTFTAVVPADGIQTSQGAFPAAALSIPETTIDSLPHAPPTLTPTNPFVLTAAPPGSEDAFSYAVPAAEANGATRLLAFFNNGALIENGSTFHDPRAAGALMRPVADPPPAEFPDGEPAIWNVTRTTAGTVTGLLIGDGTGITKSVLTARNNQLGDDLWVAEVDGAGNVSTKVRLTNDVMAPRYDTYTVAFPANQRYNAATTTIPVTGNLGATGSGWENGKQYARLFIKDPATGAPVNPTPYVLGAADTSATTKTTNVNPSTAPASYAQGAQLYAEAYAVDAAGNESDHSAAAPPPQSTTAVVKDTLAPLVNSVMIKKDVNAVNTIDEGDVVHVEFSEPVTGMVNAAPGTPCNPGHIAGVSTTADDGTDTCVNRMLKGLPTDSDTVKWVIFGTDPGVQFNASRTAVDITVGKAPVPMETSCAATNPNAANCQRMITSTDKVCAASQTTTACGSFAQTNPLKDDHDNVIDATVAKQITSLGLVPVDATTQDNPGSGTKRFNQVDWRDGTLESVSVMLNLPIDASSLSTARTSFFVRSNGEELTPASIDSVNGGTTLKLNIEPVTRSLWHSGATPTIELRAAATCAGMPCTGLKDELGDDVKPFTTIARDTAGPSVMSVRTRDDDADGHLDHLEVRYSEPVKHGAENENPCGYSALSPETAYNTNATETEFANCPSGTPGGTFLPIDEALTGTGLSDRTILKLVPLATECTSTVTPGCDTTKAATIGVRYDLRDDTIVQGPPPDLDGTPKPITDAAGNTLPAATSTVAWSNSSSVDPTIDGAGPAIVSRITRDRDADGRVDEVEVGFSEAIFATRLGLAHFEITEPAHTMEDIDTLAPIDSRNIRVAITETDLGGAGDTATTPKVKYVPLSFEPTPGTVDSRGLTGIDGNPVPPDSAGKVTKDGAAPAIMAASFNFSGQPDVAGTPGGAGGQPGPDSGLKMKVYFSENLKATPTLSATSRFELVQPPHAAAGATAIADGLNAAEKILTFAPPAGAATYSLFDPGTVKLTAIDMLEDALGNKNKLMPTVPFMGYPTAKLSLSGVAGSNPGFSLEQRGFTGAQGSGSVTKWLFVIQLAANPDPLPPTSASDVRFVTTRPDEWFVEADGLYEAWLWTADAAGNITHRDGQATGSPVAEGSIEVLATPPVIEDVRLVNSRTGYVRDGDTVRVTARAKGMDAQRWGSGDQTCFVEHLWADYSQLLSDASKDEVAASYCGYRTSTTPPHRALEFPFVTVSGTTHYPVGTVIRTTTSSTDPGWIIEDSPTGPVKRRFLSVAARRTWMIKDSAVVTAPSAVLSKIKTGPTKSFRDGALLRASGTSTLWVVDNGRKRQLTSTAASYYRYTSRMVNTVSATDLRRVPTTSRMVGRPHVPGTYVRQGTTSNYFVILRAPNGSLRRREVSRYALGTHVPSAQVVPANASDMALPLDGYVRGYRDGHMIRRPIEGTSPVQYEYYVISRGKPRKFAGSSIFNAMGYNAANAVSSTTLGFGYVRGGSWTFGTEIDYTTLTATVSVRNLAGRLVTESILLKALGTKEAAPEPLPTNEPSRP